MDLDKIFEIIEDNPKLFNLYYNGLDFEAHTEENGDETNIYIKTKSKRDNSKKRAEMKRLFKAKEVMYIEEMEPECTKCGDYHPPFWAITW